MPRISILLMAPVLTLSLGCGYGSHNYMSSSGTGAAPSITQLVPSATMAGSAAFMLTINGTGFGTDSVVYWNSVPQSSTYLGGSQVTAQITAADVMNPGMVPVYVRSGGRNSNTVNFNVQ